MIVSLYRVKVQVQMDIAVEEIFVNIAHYAYQGTVGKAAVHVRIQKEPAVAEIIFKDEGTPYNPLEKRIRTLRFLLRTGRSAALEFIWSKKHG